MPDKILSVRFRLEEYAQLLRLARKHGQAPSWIVRMALHAAHPKLFELPARRRGEDDDR